MVRVRARPGPGPRPRLAAWQSVIANAIGGDFVSNVTCVAMPANESEANCQDLLARLGDFERLEYVNLVGPLIGDDVIASLRIRLGFKSSRCSTLGPRMPVLPISKD